MFFLKKSMTTIFFFSSLLILILSIESFSQTKIIAQKSHSGKMIALNYICGDGNFGLKNPELKRLTKLSDTSVIAEYEGGFWTNDTIYNSEYCNNPNVSLDSLKKLYPSDVEFVGFEIPLPTKQLNGKRKKKEGSFFGFLPNTNDTNFGVSILFVIIIGLISLIGLFSWRTGVMDIKSSILLLE